MTTTIFLDETTLPGVLLEFDASGAEARSYQHQYDGARVEQFVARG